MMLTEETAVPVEALPVEQFKDHLRLGTGFGESGLQDGLLESFLRAAILAVEARTGKALIARDFTLRIGEWRGGAAQPLYVAPVQALNGVTMIEADGTERAEALSRFRLEPDAQRPVLAAVGTALPTIPSGGAVRVSFRAGFADSWDRLPADLAQAVLLLAAHYYEYRHETALGEGCMPFGVTALIERYRAVRLFGGGEG